MINLPGLWAYLGCGDLHQLFSAIIVIAPCNVFGIPDRLRLVVSEIAVFRGIDSQVHGKTSGPKWQKRFRQVLQTQMGGRRVVEDAVGEDGEVVCSGRLLSDERSGLFSWYMSHLRLLLLLLAYTPVSYLLS